MWNLYFALCVAGISFFLSITSNTWETSLIRGFYIFSFCYICMFLFRFAIHYGMQTIQQTGSMPLDNHVAAEDSPNEYSEEAIEKVSEHVQDLLSEDQKN